MDIDQDHLYQPQSSSSLQQRLLIHTCAFKGSGDERHRDQKTLGNKHLSAHITKALETISLHYYEKHWNKVSLHLKSTVIVMTKAWSLKKKIGKYTILLKISIGFLFSKKRTWKRMGFQYFIFPLDTHFPYSQFHPKENYSEVKVLRNKMAQWIYIINHHADITISK